MAKVVFKKDNSNQLMLLPLDLGSLVPEKHVVRVIDKIVNELTLSPLFQTYKGGGASSYSPRMLLKVIIFGYIDKTYTCRRIAKALRENVNYMWLSGMSKPDFTTINNFRSKRMKDAVDEVFYAAIEIMITGGYIKADNLFVDGTKIEANANKYSYIWKKNVERQEDNIKVNVKKLLLHVEELQRQEDEEYGSHDLEEVEGHISAEEIDNVVKELNNRISEIGQSKKVSSGVNKIKKEVEKLKKTQQQKDMLGGRNSCSKTDKDATFFKMKEDHIGMSQLKPAYNVQIATENQYILGYGVYQKAADTSVFIPFMDKVLNHLSKKPANVITDAGYGSEENYEYVTNNHIGNYLKYQNFKYEKTRSFKNRKFLSEHFEYDKDRDIYRCPAGQILDYAFTKSLKTTTGYNAERMVYRARDCNSCPHKQECNKGSGNRTIEVSPRLIEYKNTARNNLESKIGIQLRSQRGVDVESVFGQIKHNRQFRRFYTRGLKNVNTEWALISLAHNIKKMAN
jgi:transposase